MTETMVKKGKCLCGAVGVTAESASGNLGACHCESCRRWGGGPFMTADCGSGVSFTGEENITVFDSSEWAERGFCRRCGTHLFYRLKQNQHCFVSAGLLDEGEAVVFTHQVFIDQKPAWYTFANKTENLTGKEVFAKYGA